MRIQYLYDQGSSGSREDGLVVSDPFFGVTDATSAPFSPKNPPVLFGRWTGGEMVARTIEKSFRNAKPSYNLVTALHYANQRVAEAISPYSQPSFTVDRSPGACFATAKVHDNVIEISQAGDCYAVWVDKKGQFYFFPNQVRLHDAEMNAMIETIMIEVAREMNIDLMTCSDQKRNQVRQEMWNRFFPILSEARRKNINNPQSHAGYGFLNGRLEATGMWQSVTLPREETDFLLLCTDGMIPWETMKTQGDSQIVEALCQNLRKGGLAKILAQARLVEETSGKKTYLNFAEATGLAIEF